MSNIIDFLSESAFAAGMQKIKNAVLSNLSAINTALVSKGGSAASGYADVPSKIEAIESAQPILFTSHGTMYQEIQRITNTAGDGFYAYAYRFATQMKELYVPNISTAWGASSSVFEGCTALEKAELNVLGQLGTSFFNDCNKLKSVLLGYQNDYTYSISARALEDTILDTLILPGQKVCTLSNVSAFSGTPFRDTSSSGGTVYVPRALISDYEQATNWSALENCTFAAIEGSEYDDSQ